MKEVMIVGWWLYGRWNYGAVEKRIDGKWKFYMVRVMKGVSDKGSLVSVSGSWCWRWVKGRGWVKVKV